MITKPGGFINPPGLSFCDLCRTNCKSGGTDYLQIALIQIRQILLQKSSIQSVPGDGLVSHEILAHIDLLQSGGCHISLYFVLAVSQDFFDFLQKCVVFVDLLYKVQQLIHRHICDLLYLDL